MTECIHYTAIYSRLSWDNTEWSLPIATTAMSPVDKELILPTPHVYKKAMNNLATLAPCTAEDLTPFLETGVCDMV
jgi:hypothetical protein